MYHIIVNPASKSGEGKNIWNQIETVLKEKNVKYEVAFTAKPYDAMHYASSFSATPEEDCCIIVLGGDGTLNEVAQGLQNFDQIRIGYIPTGSSNDFARDLKISKEPFEALSHILDGSHTQTVDVGEVTYHAFDADTLKVAPEFMSTTRRFLVSAGIGFDAGVCEQAMCSKMKDTLNRMGLGKLTYVGIALRQLLFAPKCGCTYQLAEEKECSLERFIFIAGMNTRFEGGGFKFAPTADSSDGMLDACIAGRISIPKILFIIPQAFWGGHTKYRGIRVQKTKALHIKTQMPLWVHTDGEVLVKATDISMCCNKYQLTFYL